jgi:hypothetical protein
MISDEEAKLGQKALEVVHDTGAFLHRVFGQLVEDAVGVVADRVRFYRLEQYLRLTDRVQALLKDRPHLRPVPPKIALDLIEAATIEQSDELSELWAWLLANAMDASQPSVHVAFVPILREMMPREAHLLQALGTFQPMAARSDWTPQIGARWTCAARSFAHTSATERALIGRPKSPLAWTCSTFHRRSS